MFYERFLLNKHEKQLEDLKQATVLQQIGGKEAYG